MKKIKALSLILIVALLLALSACGSFKRVNEDKIYMTKREILELIVKINEISPKTLVKRHKELLQKKKI